VIKEAQEIPPKSWRTIQWSRIDGRRSRFQIELIPIRIPDILESIRHSDREQVHRALPELKSFIRDLY